MARYRLSQAAERDLQEIKDYIARHSPEAAEHVLDELERAFLRLAEMPGMGHRREDLTAEGFLFWSVCDWLVVYEPDSILVPSESCACCTLGEKCRASWIEPLGPRFLTRVQESEAPSQARATTLPAVPGGRQSGAEC